MRRDPVKDEPKKCDPRNTVSAATPDPTTPEGEPYPDKVYVDREYCAVRDKTFFDWCPDPEEFVTPGKTVRLAVYQLVGYVDVAATVTPVI